MKIPILLFLTAALTGQEPSQKPAAAEALASTDNATRSVIIIEPKTRATDFAQAFDFLRKDKPSQRIAIKTTTTTLNNVTDITPSTGGTLLFIKLLSNQGPRTHMVPIELITEIGYSP